MKPIQYLCGLLIATLFLPGCEEDVNAPLAKSSYPVVYCILDKDDSAHYVRLTKTFSGPVDANAMAQNPDSLYYKNARVFAELSGKTVEMEPTNEIKRDSGVFFSDYSLLYKTTYRLCGGVRIQWDGVPGVCQTIIRFKYLEITDSGLDTCHVDWTRKSADFAILPQDLLDYLNHWIPDQPVVRYRKVLGFDILVSTGNGPLADYMKFKDWSIDFIDKPYSNLINAYGLVTARVSGILTDYVPNQRFIDTLVTNSLTEHLRFVRW